MGTVTAPVVVPLHTSRRDCNLIRKVGISSGVICRRLASRLSKHYRLRSIAGSSAGAIGADAAVAELRRAGDDSEVGIGLLERLPDVVNERINGGPRLLSLLRPVPRTAPLFGILMAGMDAQQSSKQQAAARAQTTELGVTASPVARMVAMLRAQIASYWRYPAVGALPGVALIVRSALVGGQTPVIGAIGGISLLLAG